MENYDVRNYIKHKAFAQSIISELSVVLQKVQDKASKIADHYNNLNLHLNSAKTIFQAEQISKNIDDVKSKLIYILTVCDKIDKIIERNKKRIKLLDNKIVTEKVTVFNFSKKDMMSLLQAEKVAISDEALNLKANNKSTLTFYCDTILHIEDNELSLKNHENYKILNALEDKEFKIITDKFPKSLVSISDEQFLDIRFKHRVIRQIISVCDARLRNATAQEMNEFFGSPLFLNYKIPNDMHEFVDEIKNLFNVKTKRYVISKYPYLEEYANTKLICDENSQTLPKDLTAYEEVVEGYEDVYDDDVLDEEPVYEEQEETSDIEVEDSDDSEETVDDFNQFLMDLLDGNDDED